jgi:hypothetical protein
MRKLTLLALLLATAGAVQAAEGPKFEARKALALKALAERQQVLAQEQACVQGAANHVQLEQCMHTAKQARETMGAALRQEAQALKKPH